MWEQLEQLELLRGVREQHFVQIRSIPVLDEGEICQGGTDKPNLLCSRHISNISETSITYSPRGPMLLPSVRATRAKFSLIPFLPISTILARRVSSVTAAFVQYLPGQVQDFGKLVSVYFRIHMQEHRFPPLPNHREKNPHNKLTNILKVTRQEPVRPALINRSESNGQYTIQVTRGNTSSNGQRHTSQRSTSGSRSKTRPSSVVKCKINSSHQLFHDGSAYLRLPKVTAKSWILFEMKQQRCLYGLRDYKRREIASLTKMLNLATILNIVSTLKLEACRIKARASARASCVIGTTAQLKENALYSLEDLYYGMMLPSGNDAATMIAEIGGCLLKAVENGLELKKLEDAEYLTSLVKKEGAAAIGSYLREMNRFGKEIGMLNTNLVNPHGLSNTSSFSTASDLAKLCTFAMKSPVYRKIVNTQQHSYSYQPPLQAHEPVDKENLDPNMQFADCSKDSPSSGVWENTNRMLGEGWSGIKTGITPNAGPCLAASCLKTVAGRQYEFLIILLGSESMQARWSQVRALVAWVQECKLYE